MTDTTLTDAAAPFISGHAVIDERPVEGGTQGVVDAGFARELERELAKTRAELNFATSLITNQSAILAGVANALNGEPAPGTSHSHHDLADRAKNMRDAAREVVSHWDSPTWASYVKDLRDALDEK